MSGFIKEKLLVTSTERTTGAVREVKGEKARDENEENNSFGIGNSAT